MNAVHILRSGAKVDNQVQMPDVETPSSSTHTTSPTLEKSKEKKLEEDVEPPRKMVAPFPNRLKPKKNQAQMEKFLDLFKQVKINVPLLDAIEQVPAYAKFLKDMCMKKKAPTPKKVFLAANLSEIFSGYMLTKYKDPGCPTISCKIGNTTIDRALVDLGAGVNLLPYSVYKQLGVGELKPTKVTIQLADRSVKKPRGELEDVLIKVNEFVFPVDFIVLDTAPVNNPRGQTPMILGRPFLATADALINCRTGSMKLTFGNMTLDLNIFNRRKQPSDPEDEYIDVNEVQELPSEQAEKETSLIEQVFHDEREDAEESSENNDSEKRRWLTHVGPPIYDEDPNEQIKWRYNDLYDDPFDCELGYCGHKERME